MAELARQKDGQRDEWRVLEVEGAQVERQPQFGDAELTMAHHALEDVGDDALGVEGRVDSVDDHGEVDQRADVLVIVKADVHLEIAHTT